MLLLGVTGLLGRAASAELTRRGIQHHAPTRETLDLSDLRALPARLTALAPSAILNLAGFTDVAAAERPERRAEALALNVELPGVLAAFAERASIPLLHVSTDYVFDGEARAPYREPDATNPIQRYGEGKLAGERAALERTRRALIARTSTLYGPGRPQRPAYVDAIVAQARALAAEGGILRVVEHPVSSPTYAPDAAPVLLDLLESEATGIVHVVNEGAASRLELARAVVEEAGLSDRVYVAARGETPGALRRPAYSVLDTAKLESLIGRRLPPWRDALSRYMRELAG